MLQKIDDYRNTFQVHAIFDRNRFVSFGCFNTEEDANKFISSVFLAKHKELKNIWVAQVKSFFGEDD